MEINKIQLQSQGIKKALRNYKMYDSVAEYIWNGFDAQATKVEVLFCKNELGGINSIIIRDNGHGIEQEQLKVKFTPMFESEKAITINKNNISTYHGKNGVGRLTFFTFAQEAEWKTTYEKDNKKYTYNITINASTLEEFSHSEKQETSAETGTTVTLNNVDEKFSVDELNDYIQTEFSWYIELKRQQGCKLYIDNKDIDNTEVIEERSEHKYTYENISYDVTFCRWKRKLNKEFSKYYYINADGIEKFKENTTLNNKGDKFFHSVYIKSLLFDDFSFENPEGQEVLFGKTKGSAEYRFIKHEVDKLLREKRNPFIKEYTKTYLIELKKNGAYPKYQDTPFDVYRKDALDAMISNIYYAEPKIFSKLNITQQKTLVRLFDLILQSNELDSLFDIIGDIVDMSDDERKGLSEILEYTTMSNVTKTINLLKDRAIVIEQLKSLVFDKSESITEAKHIQPFIENNYWIFGEQYHLVTAEEPDFEEALRRFRYILNGEKLTKEESKIDSPDKNKEMDIFAVRQSKHGDIKKCIVVELKRPSVTLGSKELTQVKTYFKTIQSEDRFNADNIEWEFYLVGNTINTDIENEYENASSYGEKYLVFKVKKCKIYVKRWSDIITEFEINNSFLLDKLQLQQNALAESRNKTANEIVEEQATLSSAMPPEVKIS